jgi:hypothetical protein
MSKLFRVATVPFEIIITALTALARLIYEIVSKRK